MQGFMKIYDVHTPYESFICSKIQFGYKVLNVNVCNRLYYLSGWQKVLQSQERAFLPAIIDQDRTSPKCPAARILVDSRFSQFHNQD